MTDPDSQAGGETPEEFELLDAWKGGDKAAGNELLRRQFELLYRFFRTKVPEEAVGELIQQTLLTCVEKREQFRGESQFSTYVFTIARRISIAYYRARSKGAKVDPASTSIADLQGSPSGILLGAEQDRLLLAGLRSIPFDHQVLLELHYWEHLTGPQLAKVLELPEGTVRTRLRRAKEMLREAVDAAAASSSLARVTVDNLAAWAASLRGHIGRGTLD